MLVAFSLLAAVVVEVAGAVVGAAVVTVEMEAAVAVAVAVAV